MMFGRSLFLRTLSSCHFYFGSSRMNQASIHITKSIWQGVPSETSSEKLVLVEKYQSITILGLNRPTKRNALNSKLIEALRKELETFQADENSVVAILYGIGGSFCAGLDLDDFPSDKPSIPLVDEFCCKPVIASLNGYAVAEGFDLAMACDVRVADDHTILGSFNRRFGVPTSASALKRLSSIAGFGFTLDIVLTGRPIKAAEAFQKGIINDLTKCGTSKGNAISYAQSLTKYPQHALRADRAALFQTLALSNETQKAIEEERLSSLARALKNIPSERHKFSEGIGKHGSFKNITKQERPEWMKS